MSNKDYSHQTPAVAALEKKQLEETFKPSIIEQLLTDRKNSDPTDEAAALQELLEARKTHPALAKYYMNVRIGKFSDPISAIERLRLFKEHVAQLGATTPTASEEPHRHG